MVKRRLKNLANLGHHAKANTLYWEKRKKLRQERSGENGDDNNKENQPLPAPSYSLYRRAGVPERQSSRLENSYQVATLSSPSIGRLSMGTQPASDTNTGQSMRIPTGIREEGWLPTESKLWSERKPPSQVEAIEALERISLMLKPPAATTTNPERRGYDKSKITNQWTRNYLEEIQTALHLYSDEKSDVGYQWTKATNQATFVHRKPLSHGKLLRRKIRLFISEGSIPKTRCGDSPFRHTRIESDEELSSELNLYLQSRGKYVRAEDLVTYLDLPSVQSRYGLSKSISKSTARRWMEKLGYRWVLNHRGQYVDGHEREDVVAYRQDFLAKWFAMESRMMSYDGDELVELPPQLGEGERQVIAWFHDESTFYAHDRRTMQWVIDDASPTPYAKGEGLSIMVADFVSAEFGWLRSKDGSRSARVLFRGGKNRDGWFDHTDILSQVKAAMDILDEEYPGYEHVFLYDNAPSHLKRSDDAISARKMPKYPSKWPNTWQVETKLRDDAGKVVHDSKGKPVKGKIPMAPGRFRDGSPHSFYWHPPWRNGQSMFKGMAIILLERGYGNMKSTLAQCPNFDCPPDNPRCCCRRILYNEPDFVKVPSLLEELVTSRGSHVLILPKYHCELNPIEQCWGRAKQHYRLLPESSKEDVLERNTVNSLNKVSLEEIRRYARRARRFMDAYKMGLDGKQAAWAQKKFRSHRAIPVDILTQLDNVTFL